MTCRIADLQDLAYGFLDNESERRVRRHLDGCPNCVADFERMDVERDVLSRAVSTPLPVAAPTRPRTVAAVPLAFAAALLLSLLGTLFLRPSDPTPGTQAAAFVPLAQQKQKKTPKQEGEDGSKKVKPPVKKAPDTPPVKKGPKPVLKNPNPDKKGSKLPPVKKRPGVPPVKKGPKLPPVKKGPKPDGAKEIPLKLKRLYLELKRTKDPAERARIEAEIARVKALLNAPKKPAPKKPAPAKKTPRNGKAPK